MITVTLFIRENCAPCDQAVEDLHSLQEALPHQLAVVNIEKDEGLREKLGGQLPIVEIGPYHLRPPFNRQDLQIMLGAARNRVDQLQQVDQVAYEKRLERGQTISTSDRITRFLSYHYLAVVNVLLLLYVGMPFLAPVLMKTGHTLTASVIYKVYSPMCHQLAFRSFFLFGAQPYYPRALAGVANVTPYETLVNSQNIDFLQARAFVGNATVGYKVALCERDVAIYGFMFLFGMAFAVTGRRFRSLPWYLWIIIGMVPIAVDGFSQLPSLATLPASLAWLPIRESTPMLRVLTGGLFGWMTAWYLMPMLEETARESRKIFERKYAVIDTASAQNRY